MSPTGRLKGEYQRAQHEGARVSARPGRRHTLRRLPSVALASALIAGLTPSAWSAAADHRHAAWQVDTTEPRAYGHTVGDRVRRQVQVYVPAGYALDEETLPKAVRRGVPIELRSLTRQQHRDGAGSRLELTFDYQVFLAPREVRTLELPPMVLGFKGSPRSQDVRVEAWPLTVSPLVPVDVSPRRGLGELQPDAPPPLIDTRAGRWRLAAYAVIASLLLAYLALVYVGLPWRSRQRRPFTVAWRALKAMPELVHPETVSTAPAQHRLAFQRLHDALNQTAGEVVFEHSVDRFVAAQPRYAVLHGELSAFFQHSRAEFFGGVDPDAARTGTWLIEFSRKCRDAERGAA